MNRKLFEVLVSMIYSQADKIREKRKWFKGNNKELNTTLPSMTLEDLENTKKAIKKYQSEVMKLLNQANAMLGNIELQEDLRRQRAFQDCHIKGGVEDEQTEGSTLNNHTRYSRKALSCITIIFLLGLLVVLLSMLLLASKPEGKPFDCDKVIRTVVLASDLNDKDKLYTISELDFTGCGYSIIGNQQPTEAEFKKQMERIYTSENMASESNIRIRRGAYIPSTTPDPNKKNNTCTNGTSNSISWLRTIKLAE